MFVSIDLCLVPIGVGTSLSPYIKECIKIIKQHGLQYELGPNGTAIEGKWEEVFKCVRTCHERIHSKGAPRIYTTIKVNTRIDKNQSFKDKLKSVIDN
tara:strand:+ start:462 stop:755 length:294 start_codon:yes stop_codon:yes gene_type:complete